MFKFLKSKIKSAVESLSKKVDECSLNADEETQQSPTISEDEQTMVETKEEVTETKEEPKQEIKKKETKPNKVKKEKQPTKQPTKEPSTPKPQEPTQEQPKQKTSFFSKLKKKITTKKLSKDQFEDLFWDLEIVLLENNVAIEVVEKIKQDLETSLTEKPLKRSEINNIINDTLKNSIEELLTFPEFNLLKNIKTKKPYIICLIGINGSGKTTTIAKLAHYLKQNNITSVLAAADTFRAAAIDQLEEHANNLNIKLIKHDYGADAAAVAYDAIEHAKAKHIDAVLIDTAGRLHSNKDLMREMEKIIKVANPDLKLFIGESITGNDCIEQARTFDKLVGIDGIILSKADVDEKGGTAISITYITKKPILFIGTGQNYKDLELFKKNKIIKELGL